MTDKKKEVLKNFSKDEIEQMRDAFSLFDRDNDGHITLVELKNVMEALGRKPSSTQLKYLFEKADIDGNGEIEFEEFVEVVGSDVSKPLCSEDFSRAFKAFDVDGDGYITARELHKVLNSLDSNLPESVAHELLQEVDTDGDGQISINEFIEYMVTHEQEDEK